MVKSLGLHMDNTSTSYTLDFVLVSGLSPSLSYLSFLLSVLPPCFQKKRETSIPSYSIWDTIQTTNLESKLKSITPVPNIIPFKPDLSDVDSWKSHVPGVDDVDIKTKLTALKDKVIPKPIATSSKVKVEELVSELEDDNYFTLLDSITL